MEIVGRDYGKRRRSLIDFWLVADYRKAVQCKACFLAELGSCCCILTKKRVDLHFGTAG